VNEEFVHQETVHEPPTTSGAKSVLTGSASASLIRRTSQTVLLAGHLAGSSAPAVLVDTDGQRDATNW